MPNQHAADREVMGFYIPRTLARRVRLEAKRRGLTLTAFIEQLLLHATQEIELSPEDYEEIAAATRHALRKSESRNSAKSKGRGAKG